MTTETRTDTDPVLLAADKVEHFCCPICYADDVPVGTPVVCFCGTVDNSRVVDFHGFGSVCPLCYEAVKSNSIPCGHRLWPS